MAQDKRVNGQVVISTQCSKLPWRPGKYLLTSICLFFTWISEFSADFLSFWWTLWSYKPWNEREFLSFWWIYNCYSQLLSPYDGLNVSINLGLNVKFLSFLMNFQLLSSVFWKSILGPFLGPTLDNCVVGRLKNIYKKWKSFLGKKFCSKKLTALLLRGVSGVPQCSGRPRTNGRSFGLCWNSGQNDLHIEFQVLLLSNCCISDNEICCGAQNLILHFWAKWKYRGFNLRWKIA